MATSAQYAGQVFDYLGTASNVGHTATVERDVAVGEVLVLFATNTNTRPMNSLTDSRGNSWSIIRTDHSTTVVGVSLAVCTVTTALQVGDTVVMGFTGGVTNVSQCHGFTGVAVDAGTGIAYTGGDLAASADPTVPNFTTTGPGIQIAGLASGGSQSGGVTATGFNTSLGYIQNVTGTVRGLHVDYIPLAGNNTIAHNPNGTTSRVWAYNLVFLPDKPAATNTSAFFAVL